MGKEMRLFYIAEAGLLLDTNRELMIRKLTSGYKERLSLRCSCRSCQRIGHHAVELDLEKQVRLQDAPPWVCPTTGLHATVRGEKQEHQPRGSGTEPREGK